MATVIRDTAPGKFQFLQDLGQGFIRGNEKVQQRKNLLSGLTPGQQQVGQNLPLQQLSNLVGGLAQNQFLSPTQRAQQANQGVLSNMRSQALSPFTGEGAIGIGQATPQQLQSLSQLGLISQQQRKTDPFEENLKRIDPSLRPEARRKKAGVGTKNTKITFDQDVDFDEDGIIVDSVSEFVPTKFESQAQDIANRRGAISPEDIFSTHINRIQNNAEGFNDDTEVDQSDLVELMPDIAQGAIIKGQSPITALENMFKEWGSVTLRDKGKGVFNSAEDVPLSTISPLPTKEEQDIMILQSVGNHVDEETQGEIQEVLSSGDPQLIKAALNQLRGSFSGRPRRK